jgi:serine/threonine-protein kinase
LPIGATIGAKYRLDALLGQGGMGAVYLAENVDIGKKVAIKILLPEIAKDDEALRRFKTEARAAAAIGHPNIAEVIDFGTTAEGGAFLVMEYLQGETLGGRLRRAGPLEVETVGWIAEELLAAVAAAHSKGVIHRDLKPDNVFLVEQPVRAVKVLDFGVSKFREQGQVSITRTGVVMGTPAYMSPEQARGAKDVGPASDLYAVGTVLYEALAGAPVFRGDSYNEVLAKVLTEPHPPLLNLRPGLPPPVVALIDRLLAKSVADRPADAQQARALLAEAFGSGGGGAPTLGPGTVRPAAGSSPGFAPTYPRTPAPAFAPTAAPTPAAASPTAPVTPSAVPIPPPTPRPATAPAAAPLVAAVPTVAAAAAVDHPKQKKGGVLRWMIYGALILFGLKACNACRDCASCVERESGVSRVNIRSRRGEDGKKATLVEVELAADGGTINVGDLRQLGEKLREIQEAKAGDAGLPDFEKLGSEAGKALNKAIREAKDSPQKSDD